MCEWYVVQKKETKALGLLSAGRLRRSAENTAIAFCLFIVAFPRTQVSGLQRLDAGWL